MGFLEKRESLLQRNEEWEWKYTRAHIYNEYFDWYSAVPPPFNLFYITARIINDVSKKKLVYAFPVSDFSFVSSRDSLRLSAQSYFHRTTQFSLSVKYGACERFSKSLWFYFSPGK